QFKLVVVERAEEGTSVEVVREGEKAKLLDAGEVTGFLEQVGENTTYLIHPEEILADNFVLLVTGKRDVPSPEVVEKLGKVLAGRK
ncbi:MAG: hypothetical protein HRU37_09060, partial [Roseibacillus sp.]|nr:hypothetical protein [Roseibacillus sp.]